MPYDTLGVNWKYLSSVKPGKPMEKVWLTPFCIRLSMLLSKANSLALKATLFCIVAPYVKEICS